MPSSLWLSRRRGERPVIYGRERERAWLRELLDDAIEGRGSLVLISGEAGIGKTTLVDDLIQEADQQDCFVLSGGCYDLTTTPPYGPWSEALRGYQPEDVLPQVPAWFSDPDAMGEVGSQTALFEEARRFFTYIAETRPLVLVLEDLHWSDGASLEALRHLSRALRDAALLLVVTYREDELTRRHELYQLLPLLVRESQAQRIHLHQLDRDDILEMVSNRYELEESDVERLVEHVAERSEGNPFFAEEILQGLEDERELQRSNSTWALGELERVQVPLLLRQVLDQRLATLTPETLSALQVAAVIGQIVPIDLWQEVAGLDEDAFDRVMAEALETRMLGEAASPEALEFRHALLRESLYESLILNRRRSWHRITGEALSEIPNTDPDTVARHFQESGDARAARWLIRAAVRAEENYAFRIAVEHYETAQALLEGEQGSAQARGWLLSHIGHVLRSFDRESGLAYIDDALTVARQIGDPALAGYSRNHRGIMYCNRGDYRRGLEEMEQAIQINEATSPEQLEAARKAIASIFPPGIFTNPRRLSGGGLAKIGTLPGFATGANAYVLQLASAGRFSEVIAIGEPYVNEVAQATNDRLIIQDHCRDAFFGLSRAFAMLGDPARAEHWWQQANDAYRALNHQMLVAATWYWRLRHLLTYTPDNSDALQHVSENIVIASEAVHQSLSTNLPSDIFVILLHLHQGRWNVVREMVHQRMKQKWSVGSRDWLHVTGVLAPEDGTPVTAWNEVRIFLLRLQPETPGYDEFDQSVIAMRVAASLSLDTDDLEKARVWIESLEEWLDWSGAVIGRSEANLLWARYQRIAGDPDKAHRYATIALEHASAPRQPLALIAAHRLHGELDTLLEDYDEAANQLQASLELAERCGAPYEQALTLLALAELAVTRDDAQEASRFVRAARTICEQLGAKRSLQRANQIEATLRRQPTDHPAGLSNREVEVLEQASTGATNAEIGEALFISPRTVAQHLRSVYNKLGVNSRAAAVARWAELTHDTSTAGSDG